MTLPIILYICPYSFEGADYSVTDKRDYSLGLRRRALAHYLDINEEELIFKTAENGKPSLASHPEFKFNISHSGHIWVMAVHHGGSIGVDVELHKPRNMMDRMMAGYFHSEENAEFCTLPDADSRAELFFKLWTRKEAYAKFLGEGLRYDFSNHNFMAKAPENVHLYTKVYQADGRKYTLSLAAETPINNQCLITKNFIEGGLEMLSSEQ